jgi:hypothetical protein
MKDRVPFVLLLAGLGGVPMTRGFTLTSRPSCAVHITSPTQQSARSQFTFAAASTSLHMAKKGFGKTDPPAKKSVSESPTSSASPSSSSSSTTTTTPTTSSSQSTESKSPTTTSPTQTAGQRALEQLRQERQAQTLQEWQQVRDMLSADAQVQETPAAIPEPVAQRMGARMLPFVGVPLFGGMATFVTFWYLSVYKNIELEPAMVAAGTISWLVVGLVVRSIVLLTCIWRNISV